MELPLVSVPKLCSAGCHVEFSKDDVTVLGPTQHVILTGLRDPLRNLYMVPLHQTDKRETAKSPRVTDPPQNENERSATSSTIQNNNNENEYSIHTGAGAYQIQAIPKLIQFYHAAAGYPTKEMWIRAIKRGLFATWPGLTVQRVNRYLPLTEETTMGHLQMVRQGIQSTHKKPKNKPMTNTEPPRSDRKKIHNVCVDIVAIQLYRGHRISDLPGRYPVTSRRGHQYVFLMYDYDSNYIDKESAS
eukprot:jgi/Psemu1/219480/e_gw1.977.8.1